VFIFFSNFPKSRSENVCVPLFGLFEQIKHSQVTAKLEMIGAVGRMWYSTRKAGSKVFFNWIKTAHFPAFHFEHAKYA